jgi:hypothetical protein
MKLEMQPQTREIEIEIEEEIKNDQTNLGDDQDSDDLLDIINSFNFLEETENFRSNKEEYIEKTNETYGQLINFFKSKGGEYKEDVNDIYQKYSSTTNPLVVRRENPVALAKMLQGQPIEMVFHDEVVEDRGDKYANSALWPHGPADKMSGIASAFLEGRGKAGPLVMVIGVKNNPENMETVVPEGALQEIGDIQRYGVRALSGSIKREDLAFIILRAPSAFIDPESLTESEKKRAASGKPQQIFRGFSFK